MTFEHRHCSAQCWESICIYCLRTVASGPSVGDLAWQEDNHICNEIIIEGMLERLQIWSSETKH